MVVVVVLVMILVNYQVIICDIVIKVGIVCMQEEVVMGVWIRCDVGVNGIGCNELVDVVNQMVVGGMDLDCVFNFVLLVVQFLIG